MCIRHGVETLVGAPGLVPLIADDVGRVAKPGRDWADDPAMGAADEILFQHVTFSHSIRSKNTKWLFVTI